MAIICRNCHADVTEDYEMAPANTKFRCKCGSNYFYSVVDPPKVAYQLTANDKGFLRRLKIRQE